MARLTIAKIRDAKPADKPYRLPDGEGLHLFVTPSGVRSWRWRYEVGGREQLMVLGRYPDMSLADARVSRDKARDEVRRPPPPPPTIMPDFETVARAWHDMNASRWKSGHADDVLGSLVAEVFPAFGSVPVDHVAPADVLAMLRPLEQRGAIETARRIKQRCSRVFGFAIASSWAQSDPTMGLRDALAPLPTKGHRPALLTLDAAKALIVAIDAASGQPATKLALRFLALTAQRPGEVGGLRWTELHGAEWRVPPERMKMKREHVVPLVPAALACVEAIRPLTGRSRYVFPNAHNPGRPMSDAAMGAMLIRLGYQDRHVPHGWRATFSTIMNERYPADRQVIDLMLAHVPKDAVERAYNRAAHMQRRLELAEAWADLLLDGALPASDLLTGPRRCS